MSKISPDALRTAIAVLTGGITVILDSTIVSVALHDLATDLSADVATIQWVSTAYLLALGVVIPTVGWLQSRLGAKRLWIAALTLFLIGSVLCSFAWDAPSLIAFRVVQGAGGGVMMPLMSTMIIQAATGPDRARLMSVVALPAALGPILGPVIGGLILGAGNWRWLFLVNVPLCLIGLALAWRLLSADVPGRRVRLDTVGLLLLSPALVLLLWGLSERSALPMVVGAVLLAGFVFWALRRRGDALVDLQVLRSRPTWAATALMFLTGASLYGAMVLLPLYWQQHRGADALEAGLLLIPQGVGSLLSRALAARLQDRLGARGVALVGFALVGVATVPFALANQTSATWFLLTALFVRGLGLGMVLIPLMTVAFVGLHHDEVPHASIVTRIAQQIGGSAGVALLTVILTSTNDFGTAFWWTIGFTGLAVGLSFALPARVDLTGPSASPGGPSASPGESFTSPSRTPSPGVPR
ncbi:MDR family MFS transporter [Actinoplanes sp. CA-015351]|uniref:MDR family MFS transporter n=1 Tax=Actinoplanes sp. CA-015351 TaxID=3239897 RepID=UPI003D990592